MCFGGHQQGHRSPARMSWNERTLKAIFFKAKHHQESKASSSTKWHMVWIQAIQATCKTDIVTKVMKPNHHEVCVSWYYWTRITWIQVIIKYVSWHCWRKNMDPMCVGHNVGLFTIIMDLSHHIVCEILLLDNHTDRSPQQMYEMASIMCLTSLWQRSWI